MKPIKIFLASSEELIDDRKAFEAFLYQKSKLWQERRNISLILLNWEDFIDAISQTRLQDEYNKAIISSDIFVMLFWTKVGKYTDEEFETALAHFKKYNRPLIYTYLKDGPSVEFRQESLEVFRNKLKVLQHFETKYTNTEGLLLHFSTQLDKLYLSETPTDTVEKVKQKIDKNRIFDLINKGNLLEAFEELNKYFLHENDSLNALEKELINQPMYFNPALFNTRLKLLVNSYS
jgi:hypothetical protein